MSPRADLDYLDIGGALSGGPRERRRLLARSALRILGLTLGLRRQSAEGGLGS